MTVREKKKKTEQDTTAQEPTTVVTSDWFRSSDVTGTGFIDGNTLRISR